jgi:hypothetical protein
MVLLFQAWAMIASIILGLAENYKAGDVSGLGDAAWKV